MLVIYWHASVKCLRIYLNCDNISLRVKYRVLCTEDHITVKANLVKKGEKSRSKLNLKLYLFRKYVYGNLLPKTII